MGRVGTMLLGITWAAVCLLGPAVRAAEPVLDETAHFRQYFRFGPSHYSPAAMKADAENMLGTARLDKLRKDTEKDMPRFGADPAKANWLDYVYHPLTANFSPTPQPLPSGGWSAVDFDDASWVRQRYPFQGHHPADITNPGLGQYDEGVDVGLQSAHYRARFVVKDPTQAGLTVRLVYSGGAAIYLNGKEIARGNLSAEGVADDYPAPAYNEGSDAARARTLGPIKIDPALLKQGTNVLGIEIVASRFHPIVQTNPRQQNWGGPGRPFPHCRLMKLELGPSSASVPSILKRPAGTQVWVADINRHMESTDFLPPGEAAGTARIIAAKNGSYSAQIVVGTDKPLTGLRAAAGEFTHADGQTKLPADAIQVRSLVPFPAEQWNLAYLGDERGLGAKFPDAKALADHAAMAGGKSWIFDQIASSWADSIPADSCRPMWVSVRVPANAMAGRYSGIVAVSAEGMAEVKVQVAIDVVDWSLPQPRGFKTMVGCEQNPFAVAAQHHVEIWSEDHWKLIESSIQQLGRVGNTWWNNPVIVRTEFGNKDSTMVRWVRKKDRSLSFDYAVMDRYLDLVVKHCGAPRVIDIVVMQGMKSTTTPPTPSRVPVFDEAGKMTLMDMDTSAGPNVVAAKQAWQDFARSLADHMKAKGLEQALYWGYPLETESDPELKNVLQAAAPRVGWIAGPHEMMYNGTYAKKEEFYKLVVDIRYNGNWPSFRLDQGWRSRTPHLLNPRVGGTAFALHTSSQPFAYRVLPDHALAFGRSGFARVGADEWAAVHYDSMTLAKWQTGVPVLFTLWPSSQGSQPSVRFENLLEGVQETEARIFLEQAVERGGLPADLARNIQSTLAGNLNETKFFLGNSLMRCFESYPYGWQERSHRVYGLAAQVAKATGGK